MYAECQQLLQLFGIPWLVSPTEAEAQCAFLDSEGLTQGTITDDSDIWLFGGERVYKNFFNQEKFVEFFSSTELIQHFGMTREKLVQFALLTGSDYTDGIDTVGPVSALEILAEFPGMGHCSKTLYSFNEKLKLLKVKAFLSHFKTSRFGGVV